MIMELTAQIPDITVGRAANAPHYEYMTTFGKRTAELPIDHELWRKGKDEFDTAFKAEDEAFKRYRDSELTDPLKAADEERDKLYASLRDTIKAYAKFPIAETAQHAEPLLRVIKNYKIKTSENYMKESGLIDNMLQDLFQYRTQLRRLGLEIIADRLKAANDRVRQLLAERNDQRSAQIMGELKAAREATDRAYLTLVRLTNAYALLNPDRAEAQKLVALVSEDLEYFRKHAMSNPNANKKKKDSSDTDPQPDAEPAEA